MANFSENPETEVSYRTFDDDTTSLSEIDIPLRPENRRKTDRYFVIVFILAILAVIPFMVYTLIHSDINRFVTVSDIKDKRQKNNEQLFGPQQLSTSKQDQQWPRDISYGDFSESHLDVDADKYDGPYSRDSRSSTGTTRKKPEFSVIGWRVTFATFISLGLCVTLAYLFRYATAATVWGILGSSLVLLILGTIGLWTHQELVGAAIFFTILTIVYICLVFYLKEKIRLAIMLLKEAVKASFQMHMVFAVPAVIVTLILVIVVVYCITTVYMSTAGYFIYSNYYAPDGFMKTALILNSCVTLWVVEFLAGVQYMIIGGAVTKWYFSRNKDHLGNPVYTSAYVTIKYHLGTVIFGSLIITLVTIIRHVLRGLASNHRLRCLVACFMDYIETFLRFFTTNSYIVTAMHGTPFIKSGKQAVKLLTLNICNTITVTSIGDFVIAVSYFFVVFFSLLTVDLMKPDDDSYNEVYKYVNFFVIVASTLICVTILGTFETAFSTLFLCVCQDFLINNGEDKPYAMTRDLMEYLEASKKLYAKKIEEDNLPTI